MSEEVGLSTESEHDLLQRAQQGDRHAFGDLVRYHRQGVVNVVFRLCGDANMAEDAAQETFIRAWQHLPRYRPKSAFRNWLYRIAANMALDELRRRRATVDVDTLTHLASDDKTEAAVEGKEQSEYIRQATLSLPPASRTALVLREYEGLSYKEIAAALDIPIGTVMSRLNYARGRLKEILGPLMEGL